jgi:hypothetical protein
VPRAYLNVMFYLLVVGAGGSVALQQVLNANLRLELGSPWWAGFISYFIGTLAMLAIAITSGEPWLPEAMAARTSCISWTGGIFGAMFIGTAILIVPRLGARPDCCRPDARFIGVRPLRRARSPAAPGEPNSAGRDRLPDPRRCLDPRIAGKTR